ncbi:MAG: LacI family transcriptional regulator [Lachnospiraceae bacterium]|jgi:LacI family transcriptional regulator|nr:LacI family transcriptional regulator [Lachnospiraceae bacterium]
MSVSAKELAAILGVSPSAVSIALNGKPGISEKTRQAILEAAASHGLKKIRRKSGAPRFINLVIYKKHGLVYGDTAFFSSVIEGISSQAAQSEYNLQVSYFYEDQDHTEQLNFLRLSESAGIILLATEMLREDILPFLSLPKPLVLLDSYFEAGYFDSIAINNHQGAFLAARYLLDCGHRQIGHLASSVFINNFSERSAGFLQAVSGTPDCRSCVIRVESTQDGAYGDMSAFLDTKPQLPTAFFADNDIIAVSCIRALKEHGYRIPEDISIIGFDDMPVSYVTSPKLTTVHVHKEVLGLQAVRRLIDKINHHDSALLNIRINVNLVVRDSVKKLT